MTRTAEGLLPGANVCWVKGSLSKWQLEYSLVVPSAQEMLEGSMVIEQWFSNV